MPTPLPRSKVKKNQTWNAESVFASPEAFDGELKSLVESLVTLKKYQGKLGDGTPNAAQDHINFLKVDSSKAPIELYKIAGVDMTSTQPIADAFEVLESYIDRLAELTSK